MYEENYWTLQIISLKIAVGIENWELEDHTFSKVNLIYNAANYSLG